VRAVGLSLAGLIVATERCRARAILSITMSSEPGAMHVTSVGALVPAFDVPPDLYYAPRTSMHLIIEGCTGRLASNDVDVVAIGPIIDSMHLPVQPEPHQYAPVLLTFKDTGKKRKILAFGRAREERPAIGDPVVLADCRRTSLATRYKPLKFGPRGSRFDPDLNA
jgi:hypothetical protein